MKQKSKCHPDRFELYSRNNAHHWELGLCPECHTKAKKTRTAERERVVRKMDEGRKAIRGPRTASRFLTTPGVTLADWTLLIKTCAGACIYCRKPSRMLAINYIVPLTLGGKDQPENAVPACPRCVHRKGKRLVTDWPAAKSVIAAPVYAFLVKQTALLLGKEVKLDERL
jgi:5-methylcytosine-specific restriction endonuclease McrA